MAVLRVEPIIEEDSIVVINQIIGEGDTAIQVFADMQTMQMDIDEYEMKLRGIRGLPDEANNVEPGEELIDAVSKAFADLPEKTQSERNEKNKRIKDELTAYYKRHIRQAKIDATILACTMYNQFTEEPTPYPDESQKRKRPRPGLITLPDPPRNLARKTERRLKQIMDAMSDSPSAFTEFLQAAEVMGVDARRRLVERDPDGFHGGGVSEPVVTGVVSDSGESSKT